MPGRYSPRFPLNLLVLLLLIPVLVAAGCRQSREEVSSEQPEAVDDCLILAMGDSLTAGLGVQPRESYPALLEQRLHDKGVKCRVVNGGVSGETSSGALSRVDWVIRMNPDIIILETGANDGLRGIDPELVRKNIGAIIKTFLSHDIQVILAGMQMVANMGPEYLAQFNGLYPELADQYPVTFMPFFLKDVALQPSLNQGDGIHPNREGYRIIADNLLPYVLQVLERTD